MELIGLDVFTYIALIGNYPFQKRDCSMVFVVARDCVPDLLRFPTCRNIKKIGHFCATPKMESVCRCAIPILSDVQNQLLPRCLLYVMSHGTILFEAIYQRTER